MTLTEQWKKGELPCGWHYIKIADIVFIDFFEGKVWKNKKDKYIDEVLAPVPSYKEWQRILHYASKYEFEYTSCVMDYENLKEENAKLKELLKECRDEIEYLQKHYKGNIDHFKNNTRLDKEINQALGEDK